MNVEQLRRLLDIYVQTRPPGSFQSAEYAKAHIRIRRGCYRFLVWRDGDKIREFYLGRLAKPSPTEGSRSSDVHQVAGEASSSCSRRVRQ